jgi:hypothetical protein
MGANQTWVVQVLRLTPDTVEVSAVTGDEAERLAMLEHGVAHVTYSWPKHNEADPRHPDYQP